jgi:four helix bundle protein
MALKFEELKILQTSEDIADGIWKEILQWKPFVRDVVGKQLARSADSIGANIAEAYGRFHYGEKIQFLYYARGSLFETKYWLNRVKERQLMTENQVKDYGTRLSELARQLNTFISELKTQQRRNQSKQRSISDTSVNYATDQGNGLSMPLFEEEDLQWIDNT